MITTDDRVDDEQRGWPIVVGTDSFMSGWGLARNGASYAGWACHPDKLSKVSDWVDARDEMKRVRVVSGDYRPRAAYCAHFHIYVVEDGHCSLR